jgi:hypothetical protein
MICVTGGTRAAKADVTVNGQTILRDVPVSYLLFLERAGDAIFSPPNTRSTECGRHSPGCRFKSGMRLHVPR